MHIFVTIIEHISDEFPIRQNYDLLKSNLNSSQSHSRPHSTSDDKVPIIVCHSEQHISWDRPSSRKCINPFLKTNRYSLEGSSIIWTALSISRSIADPTGPTINLGTRWCFGAVSPSLGSLATGCCYIGKLICVKMRANRVERVIN